MDGAPRPRAQEQGGRRGPEGSLGKLVSSNIARQAARVHTYMTGADALLSGEDSPMNGIIAEIHGLGAGRLSIAGGTDGSSAHHLRTRALDAKEHSVDTDKPFRRRAAQYRFLRR